MKRLITNGRIIALTLLVAVVGAGAMYLVVYTVPLAGNPWTQGLVAFLVIALGLAVPYWILKLGLHEAHLRNKKEHELRLEDIPKDQQQLEEDATDANP